MSRLFLLAFTCLSVGSFFTSCSSQVKAKDPIVFQFKNGKTAKLVGKRAYAPKRSPKAVKRAIAAGNRLQDRPYLWGGGRTKGLDRGYDCSGATSYILREAGLMKGSLTSRGFLKYGKKGPGKWITLYVRNGHVFLTVAGLRLDTGGSSHRTGPRWKPAKRPGKGHVMRHPSRL